MVMGINDGHATRYRYRVLDTYGHMTITPGGNGWFEPQWLKACASGAGTCHQLLFILAQINF
jgi:hypothetical protein